MKDTTLEKRLNHFLKWVDNHTYWKEDNDVPNHVIVTAYLKKFNRSKPIKRRR